MARQTRSQQGTFAKQEPKPPHLARRQWAKSAIAIFKSSRKQAMNAGRYTPSSYDARTGMDIIVLSEIMLALSEEGSLIELVERAKEVAMLQQMAER